MRVFIGFTELSGYASRLSRLLVEAGQEVWFMDISWHHYNPAADRLDGLHHVCRGLLRWIARQKRENRALYLVTSPFTALAKIAIYFYHVRKCDAAVFIGGSRVLPGYADRRIARWLGIRTVNVFLGSTSRPHFMGRAAGNIGIPDRRQSRKLVKRLRRQRQRVRAIAAACDDVIENPLCSQFHALPCIDWFQLGFPAGDFSSLKTHDPEPSTDRVRVLHCPSSPEIKGTAEIRACIERLTRNEGLPIEYTEITGMPHAEVLRHLDRCDFVIDELYSDSPLAGFASEAAWFGKPAIVGGYGWDVLAALPSANVQPPSHLCLPDGLDDAVRRLVTDRGYREALGERARRYIREFLGGRAYAERMQRVLENRVPDDWRFDPADICYVHGLGQSEAKLCGILDSMIRLAGMQGFCLQDRPDLEAAISKLVERCRGEGRTAG